MTRRPPSSWDYDQRRNARIRELREQREAPMRRRRRVEPVLLITWIAGTIALLVAGIILGFNFIFAPRVMAWVEANPGAIEHGLVQDFVRWYQPEALADEPASTEQNRITFDVPQGATATTIGQALFDQGLISNQIAFQYAVLQAGREGSLAFGTFDLFPTMRPSEIVATLRGEPWGEETPITIREGLRIEEVVAAFAASEMVMNMEEFATLLQSPPADLVNQFGFLADVPEGRSLEGYIVPETLNFRLDARPIDVVTSLLQLYDDRLTDEIIAGIQAKGLTLDEAVIIASIVEREAVIDEERPLIAEVYINRYLQPDNPQTVGLLNADPTLQYGLVTGEARPAGHPFIDEAAGGTTPVDQWGAIEWWPQLQVPGGEVALEESLLGYQTYTQAGLPPTPIAAPRTGSLEAVAAPATDNGYLFFVAGCPGGTRDGSHYFAATLDEHNANIARANEECAGQ
jgi:UPF0755 protein